MSGREVSDENVQGLKSARRTESNYTYFDDIRESNATDAEMRQGSAVQLINDTFRMANILSMVPSALEDYNSVGLSIEVAGFLAVQHFNERSGAVIPDLPERLQNCNLYLTMDLLDTGASPTTAVLELLNKIPRSPSLAKPRPLSVLGTGNTLTSESVSIIGAVNNVAQTSCCATSQELNDKSQHPFFSRTVTTNLGNARAAALYYKYLGVDHVATLHVDDLYGVEFSRLFESEAERLGIDVFSAGYDINFNSTLVRAVDQIRASELKYIFAMIYVEDMIRVADYASQGGIMGHGYVWIVGEGNDGQLTLNTTDADKRPRLLNATNGMGWIELDAVPNDLYNAALESFKQDEELRDYYLSKKVDPQGSTSANFSSLASPDLLSASDFALLNYDAAMAIGIAACEVNQDFFSAPDLFQTIAQMQFTGATGRVQFNDETGTRFVNDVRYTIQNLLSHPDPIHDEIIVLESIKSVVVDMDSLFAGFVNVVEPFVYSDNTTNQPPSLPPSMENSHLIPNWALGIGLGLSALMILTSTAWAVWTGFNRKKRVVRAAQPFFLVMLCVGTFLIASSIIPTSFQEPMSDITLNIGCMLFPWLVCMGLVTAFSALFTKNGRINALYMNARACRRVTIKPKDVIKPFLILLGLNVTILVLWTILAPWIWKRVAGGTGEDKFGRPSDTYGVCISEDGKETLSRLFGSLLAVVNMVPVVLSVYQSYRCRNLPTEFNESRYLAISMASILETFVIGLPLVLIAVLPTTVFLVRAVLLFTTCLGILLPMFIPKWLNHQGYVEPTRRVSTVPNATDTTE